MIFSKPETVLLLAAIDDAISQRFTLMNTTDDEYFKGEMDRHATMLRDVYFKIKNHETTSQK